LKFSILGQISSKGDFSCSTSPNAHGPTTLSNYSHSGGYAVVSSCKFSISLEINDVESHLMSSLPILSLFFLRHYFKSSEHFGELPFYWVSGILFYFLDSPFICVLANTFSLSSCLSFLSCIFKRALDFNFLMESKFSFCSFLFCPLNQGFLLHFPLKVFGFMSYI
jgi:hypothetical protein